MIKAILATIKYKLDEVVRILLMIMSFLIRLISWSIWDVHVQIPSVTIWFRFLVNRTLNYGLKTQIYSGLIGFDASLTQYCKVSFCSLKRRFTAMTDVLDAGDVLNAPRQRGRALLCIGSSIFKYESLAEP